VSGQISRADAVAELDHPLYDPVELETDISYFCKKLRISRQEFDDMLATPLRHHTDFPNWRWRQELAKRVQRVAEYVTGRRINVYS
jgi:hypothetical protein